MTRPLNKVSSKAMAILTDSLSENSMYANLRRTAKQCWLKQTVLDAPIQTNTIFPSPFRMASVFVTKNSDPVHVATAVKVDLQLISSRPIIHLFSFKTVYLQLEYASLLNSRSGLTVNLRHCIMELSQIWLYILHANTWSNLILVENKHWFIWLVFKFNFSETLLEKYCISFWKTYGAF